MNTRRLRVALAIAAVSALPWALRAQVYRSTTTAVSVNVSVSSGNTPVLGLTAADFVLTDQRMRQTVTSVSSGEVPIDVSLVVDVSGSTESEIRRFQSAVTAMAEMLRPIDRVRLLVFSSEVRELFALSTASALPPVDRLAAGSLSSIYDAVAVPLVGAAPVGRRHLIVAFTDGIENRSVINGDQLVALAQRSDAVLHLVSPSGRLPSIQEPNEATDMRTLATGNMQALVTSPPREPRLSQAVDATGGSIHLGSSMVNDFRKILETFRSGYVLTFRPTGVAMQGWHELSVEVTRPGRYRVQARRGYFAGPDGNRP
jgi:VWFA-related protein